MGLVGTKRPTLVDRSEIVARIRKAARYHPLEPLVVSTQCGFASSIEGNRLILADQSRKLRLVVKTAERIWC